MYLMEDEDGEITKSEEITESDLDMCRTGILTIIDISNNTCPKIFYEEEWQELSLCPRWENKEVLTAYENPTKSK